MSRLLFYTVASLTSYYFPVTSPPKIRRFGSPTTHGVRSGRPIDSEQSMYTVWRLTLTRPVAGVASRESTGEEETVRPVPMPSDTSQGFRWVGWRLLICVAYSLYLEEWVAWLRVSASRSLVFCSGPAYPIGSTRGLELRASSKTVQNLSELLKKHPPITLNFYVS
jgi:hypothetical protein